MPTSSKIVCHLDVLKASDVLLLLQGLDIGPDSLKTFQGALADAKTVIWNGPMGVFEFAAFAKGTYGVAETLAELTPKVRLPAHCCQFQCPAQSGTEQQLQMMMLDDGQWVCATCGVQLQISS